MLRLGYQIPGISSQSFPARH